VYGIQTDANGLTYMRARYYSPELGRFINEDPIRDGHNWYAYTDGNPVNRIDPTGLFLQQLWDDWKSGAHSLLSDPSGTMGDLWGVVSSQNNFNAGIETMYNHSIGGAFAAGFATTTRSTVVGFNYVINNPVEAAAVMINPMTLVNAARGLWSWGENLGASLYDGDWRAAAFAGGQVVGTGASVFAGGAVAKGAVTAAKGTAAAVSRSVQAGYSRAAPALSQGWASSKAILGSKSGHVRLPGGTIDRLNPKQIRFTQNSIASKFGNKNSLNETIHGLKSGKISPNDFPAIRTFKRDGLTFSLDNRRLHVFQEAGIRMINTVRATPAEIMREAWKFTTKNSGASIRVR
jgi:RHS repeat-associated protein